MADDVRLLIGTRKGAFIVQGNRNGGGWQVDGPTCEGWPIHDIAVEPESGALFAGLEGQVGLVDERQASLVGTTA